MRSRWRYITPLVSLGLVLAACSGGNNASAPAGSGGGSLSGATVTVIGTWTDVEQTNFLVMVAVVFALSTDYGVLLLNRIKEARDAGHDNREAALDAWPKAVSFFRTHLS